MTYHADFTTTRIAKPAGAPLRPAGARRRPDPDQRRTAAIAYAAALEVLG